MQPRRISEYVASLLQFRSRRYDHQGAQAVPFKHLAKRRCCDAHEKNGLRQIEQYYDVYLVSALVELDRNPYSRVPS